MNQNSTHQCVSCHNKFTGRFCNVCGEKVLEDSERTLWYFILTVFNEITSVDSKLWCTLRTIIFKPGQLSADYSVGRRSCYMRPITVFFLGNVLYFLFPATDVFNTLLQYQLSMPYSSLANIPERVDRAILESGLEKEVFFSIYNQMTVGNSKLLLIFLVPLIFPIMLLIGWWKRKMIAEHLLFALEMTTFVLFVNAIGFGYLVKLMQEIITFFELSKLHITDGFATLVTASLMMYFLVCGIRRFYGYHWAVTSLLSVLALLGFYLSLTAYRWLLFEVTIARMT